jgi:hypothetical protein
MPMIDVYATAGTFVDPHQLATDLATAVMTIEKVPDIPMFRQNTAAFVNVLRPAKPCTRVRFPSPPPLSLPISGNIPSGFVRAAWRS